MKKKKALTQYLKQIYHSLTYYLPKPIPRTQKEYHNLESVLVTYYGVKDDPKSWMTIAGQLTATPSDQMYKSWGKLANCAKRLEMNKIAHEHKTQAITELNKQLEKAFILEQERLKKEEDEKEDKEGIQKDHGNPNESKSEDAQDKEGDAHEKAQEIGIGVENPYI